MRSFRPEFTGKLQSPKLQTPNRVRADPIGRQCETIRQWERATAFWFGKVIRGHGALRRSPPDSRRRWWGEISGARFCYEGGNRALNWTLGVESASAVAAVACGGGTG